MLDSIHNKEQKQKKIRDKDMKQRYKLMDKAIYGKIRGNFVNRIDVKLVSNTKTL